MTGAAPGNFNLAGREIEECHSKDHFDPVIEAYQKDVDVTLLLENLKLTVQERFEKFESFMQYILELRQTGRKARAEESESIAKLGVFLVGKGKGDS